MFKERATILFIFYLLDLTSQQETIDVRCIFQPPLNNGRLTIRFNSYALFICEHRYTAEGWFIPGITNFDQPEPDIQQITQSNVTCLHNSTAACDRIIIIYIPTSTEHQNKTTQICTHINGTKHCSQEFAVQLNQDTIDNAAVPTTALSAGATSTVMPSNTTTMSSTISRPVSVIEGLATTLLPTPSVTRETSPSMESTANSKTPPTVTTTTQQIEPTLVNPIFDEQSWVTTERAGSVWNLVNNLIQTLLLLLVYPIIIWRATKHPKQHLQASNVIENKHKIFTTSEENRNDTIMEGVHTDGNYRPQALDGQSS